jgi:hypothetical protein
MQRGLQQKLQAGGGQKLSLGHGYYSKHGSDYHFYIYLSQRTNHNVCRRHYENLRK